MFDISDIWKMIDNIKLNHTVFIGTHVGLEYLSDTDKVLLLSNGIDPDSFIGVIGDIERAYYFGIMAQVLGGNKSFKTTNKQFDDWFINELAKPKSTIRKEGLKMLKNRAYTDISGIGNKISNKFSQRILTANVQQQNILLAKVKKKTVEAYEKNKSKAWLASELREATKDWARDFSRIADFVLQEAYGIGRAYQILEDHGDDVEVYKQTFPGVCKHCEKNYGNPGEEPIIYKLKDLLANGNNIGKKEQEPVVGPAHPFARSILHVKPKNSIWDNNKKEFVVQRNKSGVKRKSKVKIEIVR